MLTLYIGNRRYSSWSLRPYLALAATDARFETTTIWLDQADTKDRIAEVSPARRVPVLHHDKLVIWDSLAICEYVNELFPSAQLWPADLAARARARSVAAEMHSGFVALRRDMPMDLGTSHPGRGHTAEALADARRVIEIWRDLLAGSGGPFLFGAFTIADAMFAPVVSRFATYCVDLDDRCHAYSVAVQSSPAFQNWQHGAAAEPITRP